MYSEIENVNIYSVKYLSLNWIDKSAYTTIYAGFRPKGGINVGFLLCGALSSDMESDPLRARRLFASRSNSIPQSSLLPSRRVGDPGKRTLKKESDTKTRRQTHTDGGDGEAEDVRSPRASGRSFLPYRWRWYTLFLLSLWKSLVSLCFFLTIPFGFCF